MSYQTLLLENQGPIARLTLNRPEARNALNYAFFEELDDALGEINRNRECLAMIFDASPTDGPRKIFSAGADLRDARMASAAQGDIGVKRDFAQFGGALCRKLETCEAITIAAVDGVAVGGAVSLLMACDFRLASPDAALKVAEIDRGMNYSWGSTARLVRLVGPARAKEMILLGETISAPTAYAWGFFNRLVSADALGHEARSLAETLAGKPPLALRAIKRNINAIAAPMDDALNAMETDQYALLASSEDFIEGVTSFIEKRTPKFKGK